MKISGWVFLVLGGIVIAASYLIKGLKLFVFVGMLFVIYGIGKLISGFIVKDDEKNDGKTARSDNYEELAAKELQESRCKRCRCIVMSYDHFCSGCGIRLR